MKSVTRLTTGRSIGMNEFTLSDCRNISTLMEEECYPLIEEYLLNKCFGCKNSLEYMYALLKGGSDFIDYNMEIRGIDDKPVKVFIKLILDNLLPIIESKDFSTTLTMNGIDVSLDLPKSIYHDDILSRICHSLKKFKHGGDSKISEQQSIDLECLDDQDILSLINAIPTSLVETMGKYVSSNDHKIQIFSHPKLGSVEIDPFSNDILYKITPLFNVYDSQTLASMMFSLQPIDPTYMMALTPKEFAVILSERENLVATQNNNTI